MTLTLSRVWWINSHPKVEVLQRKWGLPGNQIFNSPNRFLGPFFFPPKETSFSLGIFLNLNKKMGDFFVPKGGFPPKKVVVVFVQKKNINFGGVFWVPRWTAKSQGAISTPWWRANCDPWRRSRWKARPGWVLGWGCVIEKMEWGGGSYKWPSIIWITGVINLITPTSRVISPYFKVFRPIL